MKITVGSTKNHRPIFFLCATLLLPCFDFWGLWYLDCVFPRVPVYRKYTGGLYFFPHLMYAIITIYVHSQGWPQGHVELQPITFDSYRFKKHNQGNITTQEQQSKKTENNVTSRDNTAIMYCWTVMSFLLHLEPCMLSHHCHLEWAASHCNVTMTQTFAPCSLHFCHLWYHFH